MSRVSLMRGEGGGGGQRVGVLRAGVRFCVFAVAAVAAGVSVLTRGGLFRVRVVVCVFAGAVSRFIPGVAVARLPSLRAGFVFLAP